MQVRLCGIHSVHPKTFRIEKPHGFGDYLFLRLKTPARFYLEGQVQFARPNDIILYQKGAPQYYEAAENALYADDYVFFDLEGPEDAAFMASLQLKYDRLLRLPSLQSFMDIHRMICLENISRSGFRQQSLHCLMQLFLIKLSESMNADYTGASDRMLEQFQGLRKRLYQQPEEKWTVAGMADSVNLSSSYFQSLYRKFFHISCMEDVFNSRMNRAKELLSTTRMPVQQVAEQCGYESNIYFSRHFRQKVGMTPSEYRDIPTGLQQEDADKEE